MEKFERRCSREREWGRDEAELEEAARGEERGEPGGKGEREGGEGEMPRRSLLPVVDSDKEGR